MKQLVNTQTPTLQIMVFGQLERGFFRWNDGTGDERGKIFFATQWGKYTVYAKVWEDGLISLTFEPEFPTRAIQVIDPQTLGVELRFEEPKPSVLKGERVLLSNPA